MADYSSQTVPKLQELLKARQLPYSGKKAELIERLREADKAAEANEAEAAPPAPAATSAPPEQTADAITQESATEPAAPTAEPTTTAAESAAPATNVDHPTDAALAATAAYSLHLPTSNVDDEIAKRKARAARFGTTATTEGDATAAETEDKALERAKRFGIQPSETAMGKLDVALPSEGPKGRRRGAPAKEGEAGQAAYDDPGLLRRGGRGGGGGRFRGRGRGRREGSAGARPTGVEKSGGAYSDRDRAAADARKKRFAQQA